MSGTHKPVVDATTPFAMDGPTIEASTSSLADKASASSQREHNTTQSRPSSEKSSHGGRHKGEDPGRGRGSSRARGGRGGCGGRGTHGKRGGRQRNKEMGRAEWRFVGSRLPFSPSELINEVAMQLTKEHGMKKTAKLPNVEKLRVKRFSYPYTQLNSRRRSSKHRRGSQNGKLPS